MNINNIDPTLWGPSLWTSMHYITFSYPDNPTNNDKQNIKSFFENVGQILPCEKCRINFAKHLSIYPLTDDILNSRYELINWLINIHNEVNKINGKKILSYDEVMKIYFQKDKCFIINRRFTIISVFVVSIILLIFWVKYNNK